MTDSKNVVVGKGIRSKVKQVDRAVMQQPVAPKAPPSLSAQEQAELQQLARQKAAIERPLRRRARIARVVYVALYLVVIVLLWFALRRLVLRFGWDRLEPWTWVAGILLVAAGPLLVWLQPQRFSPGAVEGWLFERQRQAGFEKFGFDLEQYEALNKWSQLAAEGYQQYAAESEKFAAATAPAVAEAINEEW